MTINGYAIVPYADLSGANLGGQSSLTIERLVHLEVDLGGIVLDAPHGRVAPLDIALVALVQGALYMPQYFCGTQRCIAGWAIDLAGPKAREAAEEEGFAYIGATIVPELAHLFMDTGDRRATNALVDILAKASPDEVSEARARLRAAGHVTV